MSTQNSNEVRTIPAKYIFLDVVSFSHNRSVEAQSDIVQALNRIVTESLRANLKNDELSEIIQLPTGDGICIVLLNIETPYDIHMKIGLDIVEKVHNHNEGSTNEMRKFLLRLGINANTDNLVTDINGNRNIAGAGINMAQRVMSMADGNQILVGQTVFETLSQREKYMKSFKSFQATVKHNLQIPVHQFVTKGYAGLNIDTPSAFKTYSKAPARLSHLAAYYFAHAIKHRSFFLSKKNDPDTTGIILLWFLAKDSVEKSQATEVDVPYLKTFQAEKNVIEEQYAYYNSIDFSIRGELCRLIEDSQIPNIYDYYEGQISDCRFINSGGAEKLKREWPSIWSEFGLDHDTSTSEETPKEQT